MIQQFRLVNIDETAFTYLLEILYADREFHNGNLFLMVVRDNRLQHILI